jgi:hypothetical protein
LAPDRPVLREHEQSGDDCRRPAEPLEGHRRTESHLLVMLPERAFDGRDLRLDLGDEQGLRRRMPPQEIDRTTLAIDGVRHLGRDIPRSFDEQPGEVVAKAGMSSIEQAVEVSASPPRIKNELGIHPAKDPADGSDRHPVDPATFEQRDLTLAQTDPFSEVALPPAESMSEMASDPTKPKVISHARKFGKRHSPRTCRPPSSRHIRRWVIIDELGRGNSP